MIAGFHNHTHTTCNDGQAPFGEFCTHATKSGVDILGLLDNFRILPDGTSDERMLKPEERDDYLAELFSFQKKREIEIRIGWEADWFENHRSVILPHLERLPLGYRIGSVHFRERASLFIIEAHLEIPKKFGSIGRRPFPLRLTHLWMPLRSINWSSRAIPPDLANSVLTATPHRSTFPDGRRPEQMLFEFKKGLPRLHEAGFTTLARFRDRERWSEPLSAARKA